MRFEPTFMSGEDWQHLSIGWTGDGRLGEQQIDELTIGDAPTACPGAL